MSAEKEVERKIEQYQDLAKDNKNIDLASLMINALEQARQEEIAQKKKKRAYFVSVVAPPLGLFFAVRYYFSDKPDGKRVALVCVVLTAFSFLVAWGVGSLFLSGAGPSVGGDQLQQLQAINARTLKDLTR